MTLDTIAEAVWTYTPVRNLENGTPVPPVTLLERIVAAIWENSDRTLSGITIEGSSSTDQGVDSTRTFQLTLASSGNLRYDFQETEVRSG